MKLETHYEVERNELEGFRIRFWCRCDSGKVGQSRRDAATEEAHAGEGGILGNLIVLEEEEQIRDFFKTKIQCLNDAVFLCLSVVKNMRD